MKLDPKNTALLTLDFQQGIFGFAPGAVAAIPAAAKVVEFARQQKIRVIHVGLGFEAGHPEIPDTNTRFKMGPSTLIVVSISGVISRPWSETG